MGDVSKIHIGPGKLTLTPTGGGESVDCGLTKDGAVLKFTQEIEKLEADQLLGPAGFYITGEECDLETLLAELQMDKLNIALGGSGTVTEVAAGAGQVGGKKLEFGESPEIVEYELEYKAPKRTNRALNIVVKLYIVKVFPDANITFAKNGQAAYKLRCVARPDVAKDPGKQLGYVFEETAVATG